MFKFFICLLHLSLFHCKSKFVKDENGYISYCPCMGRFGNQAEQFLGVLSFAKNLNRSLILPPWIQYEPLSAKPIFIPFSDYFQIQNLNQYHKMLVMEDFMNHLAKEVWPVEKRQASIIVPNTYNVTLHLAFCYSPRVFGNESIKNDCNAKDGSPFGPFWDQIGVNFKGSEFYGPLPFFDDKTPIFKTPNHIDMHNNGSSHIKWLWDDKFPPTQYPVLAFVGAPAPFPVKSQTKWLQKFLVWSKMITHKAHKHFYNKYKIKEFEYIGIHLRNGVDWKRTCEHVGSVEQLFSSPQCLGERREYGELTYEMCFPTKATIISQVRLLSKQTHIKNLYVASDKNHMIKDLQESLQYLGVKVFTLGLDDSQLDLYILGRSKEFIGNCVSSFTAFVVREREVHNLNSSFWAFPSALPSISNHQEL